MQVGVAVVVWVADVVDVGGGSGAAVVAAGTAGAAADRVAASDAAADSRPVAGEFGAAGAAVPSAHLTRRSRGGWGWTVRPQRRQVPSVRLG